MESIGGDYRQRSNCATSKSASEVSLVPQDSMGRLFPASYLTRIIRPDTVIGREAKIVNNSGLIPASDLVSRVVNVALQDCLLIVWTRFQTR